MPSSCSAHRFVAALVSLLIFASTSAQEPEGLPPFDPSTFSNPTVIDNAWLPLMPGHYLVLEGITVEEGEEIDHRIEFTVTGLTKEIEGIATVVAFILDYSDGELVEAEIAFYAQDDAGTVWYLGEYPEEYEDGEFLEAKPWISGVADAQAGIKMMPAPSVGSDSYFQGWGPEVEWSDYALVDAVGESFCAGDDCFDDVLVIAESSLEEDAFQLKYYAAGIGNIGVRFRGDDETQETLDLAEHGTLDDDALAEIHEMVFELEAHAFEVSETYAQTAPIE